MDPKDREIEKLKRRIAGLEKTLQVVSQHSGRLEQSLKQLFEEATDILPVPMVITTDKGEFIFSNQKARDIFGYSDESLKKTLASKLYDSSSDRDTLIQRIEKYGEARDFAVKMKKADGSVFPASLFSRRIRFKERKCLLTAIYDLTDLKEAEGTLESILRSMDDIVLVFDINRCFTECFGCQKKLGTSFEEFIGKAYTEMAPPRIVGRIGEAFDKAEKGEIDEFEYSYFIFDETRWFNAKMSSMRINNEILGHVAVVRDVTRRKRAEDDLLQLNQELEHRVKERTHQLESANVELRKARDAAEEATKAKSMFLANMSHEIRTPLNAVLGFTSLALRTDLTLEQQDYLSKIQRSSADLLALVNDILDFTKIEAGKLAIEKKPFRLEEILNDVADAFTRKAAQKGVELIIASCESIPRWVVGDENRIRQVLMNLTGNAVKFTNEGEILIRAGCEKEKNGKITVSFTVKDSGIGISREKQEEIFNVFYQVDGSTTRDYGGTGLGLAICMQLVEMMEGKIWVESQPGHGSAFTFTARVDIQKGAEQHPYVCNPDTRGIKVLIVDDSVTCNQVLTQMAGLFGCVTESADSGKTALKRLTEAADAKDPFRIVLLDWFMPEMDGLVVARKIRENSRFKNTSIILVSAFAEEYEYHQAMDIAVDAFLAKPVIQSVLFDTMMQILGKQPLNKNLQPPYDIGKAGPSTFELAGIKVLVAEDSEINREVVFKLLNSEGVSVDLVNNGKAAVDAAKTQTYDAILMDVQMPVIDGYEATRRIRVHESGSCEQTSAAPHIPIIAMTAHAMKGDREKCLNAGMDDYISKPIAPENLFSVIARNTGLAPVEAKQSTAHGVDEPDGVRDLERVVEGVDLREALRRVRGDKSLFIKMLNNFVGKYGNASERMKQALLDNDVELLKELTHALKGISGNLSAGLLHESARRLWNYLIENGTSPKAIVESKIKAVERALNHVVTSAKAINNAFRHDVDPPSEKTPEPLLTSEELQTRLAILYKSLQARKTESEDLLASLKKQLVRFDINDDYKKLEFQIENFDYKKAMDTLNRISQKTGISIQQETVQ